MAKILIVEDEKNMQDIIAEYMKKGGHTCFTADDGVDALMVLKNNPMDLMILDIMMPHLDGFSVCKMAREMSSLPIIILTAKSDEENKLKGYGYGADDYMTKPFSLAVLRARIQALLRRGKAKGTALYEEGEFMFDFDSLVFTRKGLEVALSVNEQRLLRLLIENRCRVLTRGVLTDRLWSDGGDYVDENALSVTVKRLRSKLEDKRDGISYIQTVYGQGYMWKREEQV